MSLVCAHIHEAGLAVDGTGQESRSDALRDVDPGTTSPATGAGAPCGQGNRSHLAARLAAAILIAAPLAASAASVTLYPTTSATGGSVTNPTAVYADDGTNATLTHTLTPTTLDAAGFDSTNRGTITDVTVWVKYSSAGSGASKNLDTYQFDAATNGTTFSTSILAPTSAAAGTGTLASKSLGALTWTQVGTLAVRGTATQAGASDGYTVLWDVAYIVVTYTVPSPPSAPAAPTFGTIGANSIQVNWTAVSGATSYKVERSADGLTFTNIASGVGTNSYTDNTPSANSQYWYRIIASNAGGDSSAGPSSSTYALPNAPTLNAFSGVTSSSVTVNWSAPLGGAVSYRIERAPDSGGAPGTWAEVKAGQTSSPWTDTTVASSTTYWYRVRATNTTGDGAYSANGSVTTQAGSTSPSAPGTPSYSSVTSATLTASWTASSGTAPITYTLQWGSTGTGPWTDVTGCVGLSVGTCNVTGLQGNTTYYYQVVATNAYGSATSASAGVLTLPGQPTLGAYTNVQSTLLRVNWSIAGSTSGLTYTVQRGSSATGPWANVAACVATANTYCDDTGLTASTTYWYQVQASNARGSGAWSASTSVTTGAPFVGEGDNTPWSTKPAVSIINPISGPVGAHFKVQARVASPGGVAIGTVTLHYNATSVPMLRNAKYGSAVDSGVWEYIFPSLGAGNYTLQVEAANVNGSVFSRAVAVTIAASGQGDGNLLVRDNASQLCSDCHALKSHGSDTTSNKYGSWSLSCRDCHTPHSTHNLGLVGEKITPPARTAEQVPATVVYRNNSGWGTGGMANPELNGVCQVCHTQTSVYRSNGTDIDPNTGSPIASGGHNPTGSCISCHRHDKGLKATCTSCHGTDGRTPTVTGTDADLAAAPPALATPAATGAVANGAHLKHLDSVTYRSAPLQCGACHATKSHQDGKADVSWGTLAKSGGVTPTPATGPVDVAGWPTTPTCTNWCHGAALTGAAVPAPAWNGSFATVTCTQCHGAPPPVSSAAAEDHPQNTNCDACHGLAGNAGYDFTNKTLSAAAKATHVDGTVQKPNKGCASCHGDLTVADGTSVLPGDPRAAPGYAGVGVDTTGASVRSDVSVGAHVKHVVDGLMPGNCTACHSLPAQGDVLHANGSAAVAFDALASKGVTTSWASPSCTVYCHSSGVPIGSATATPKNPVWTSTTALGCADCHAATPATNAHGKHVTGYGVACQACHAATTDDGASIVTGGGLHVNGTNDVAFTSTDALWASYVTGGSYDTVGHTCGSTYCHSNGTSSSAPFGAPVSAALAWNATDACTSCHGGPSGAAVVMGSGAGNGSAKHGNHVDNATIGANYACGDCHKATVAAGTNAPITGTANHVDRVRTVSIANRGTYASTDTTTTCSSTYCHSSGQRQFGTKLTVGWTDAAWTGNVCAKCHGTTTTTGAPDYANAGPDTSTSNSHAKHAPASTDCATCHNGYVTAAGTAIAGSSHTNGSINVGWDTTKAGTGVVFTAGTYTAPSTYTSATCANVKCHGYNATALKWGGPSMKCSDCHTSATADTDSFAFGTAGIINTTEWGTTGHGQGTFGANTFPTIAAGTPCLYCHDGTVSHDVGGNPFRLRGATGSGGQVTAGNYSASTTTSANQVCLNCHAVTGSNGVYLDASNTLRTSTKKIDAAHAGTKHTAAQNGGLRCWDCHDPHGDGNIKMVGKSVVKASTDNHSFTATRIPGVTFTANATGTDYAGTSTKLCNVCHSSTAYYLASGTGNQTHMAGSKCVNCHAHEQGTVSAFAPVDATTSCNGCHSGPPTAPASSLIQSHAKHFGVTTVPTSGYVDAGNYGTASAYGFGCASCHPTTATSHMNDSTHAGTTGSAYTVELNASLGYTTGATKTNDTTAASGLVFQGSNATCASAYCHSNATPVGKTATYQTATWGTAGPLACTACHGGKDAATTMSASHAKHVNTNYAFGCQKCHTTTTTTGTSITDASKHADGNKQQVTFDNTADPKNPSGAYSGGTTYTCSSVYCHSDGQPLGAAAPTYQSPKWTDAAFGAGTCSQCHGTQATLTTNKHGQHVNQATVIGTNFGCADCHNGVVSGNTTISNYSLHVNGAKNVAFPLRNGMTSAAYASPTCGSNYCHSSGRPNASSTDTSASQYYPVAWNQAGALDCKGCHGAYPSADVNYGFASQFGEPNYKNGGANVVTSNSHQKHATSAATCAICHQQTTATGTSINGSYNLHIDGQRQVTWDATRTTAGAGYAAASKSCSSTGTACHASSTPTWGATLGCRDCHLAGGAGNQDVDNYVYNDGTRSWIDQEDWLAYGHGATAAYAESGLPAANFDNGGAIDGCAYCHDTLANGGADHGDANNPFRLKNTGGADGKIGVCLSCHKTGSTGVTVGGVTRNRTTSPAVSATHYGAEHTAKGTAGGQYCWDCHDPHGDYNYGSTQRLAYMIQEVPIMNHTATTTSTDWGIPRTTADQAPTPDFRSLRDGTAGWGWGDYVSNTLVGTPTGTYRGVCQVCHTSTALYFTQTAYSTHNQTSGQRCTGCHTHEQPPSGAFGASESGGGSACGSCHQFFTSMKSGSTGHYHLMATDAVGYPTLVPTSSATDTNRKCLQCHVDHNIFRPDLNASGGRGKNLRTDIALTPTTTANFTNKDFDAALPNGGICVSCHTNGMPRAYTDSTAGATTMPITKAAFGASAHTFSGAGTTATFGGTLTNTMVGDCGKCHDDTTTKSYQTGYPQATHNSTLRGMAATLGITAPADPLAEKLCYRCHSQTTDTTPGGGPAKTTAGKDYFGIASMTSQSEKIFTVVTNSATYPFGHPIGSGSALHKASDGEGAAANDGTLSGANRHATCADCHNPHAAKRVAAGQRGTVTAFSAGTAPSADTLTDTAQAWTANQWKGYTVKILSGTGAGGTSAIYGNTATTLSVELATAPAAGSAYAIIGQGTSAGNQLGGAEAASWGLAPTFPAQPTPPNWSDGSGAPTDAADLTAQYNAITAWGRTTSPTVQGQMCIKCHSAYAYGATPPSSPSGLPISTSTTWSNTTGGTMPESDIANQFNPNNLSHHAVFARGKNQPLVSSATVTSTYNPNWPKFTSGTGITVSTVGCAAAPCNVTLTGSTWPITVAPGWFIYLGSAAPAQATAGWYEVTGVTSTTVLTVDRATSAATSQAFMLTAGLGNNFVPPWGPWSTLQCTDCHSSDNVIDPFGPHGSGTKWSLQKAAVPAFLFYNGTASTPTNVVSIAPGSLSDANNLCVNCHRRDVYGDYNSTAPVSANYARQSHPIDLGKNHSLTVKPKWGIVCMNCHGGARSGTIHGTNLGKGNNGTTVGSYSGKRLLAGSNWYGVTRSSTTTGGACWTKGSADNVDNCAHTHSGVTFLSGSSGMANYNYDTNP